MSCCCRTVPTFQPIFDSRNFLRPSNLGQWPFWGEVLWKHALHERETWGWAVAKAIGVFKHLNEQGTSKVILRWVFIWRWGFGRGFVERVRLSGFAKTELGIILTFCHNNHRSWSWSLGSYRPPAYSAVVSTEKTWMVPESVRGDLLPASPTLVRRDNQVLRVIVEGKTVDKRSICTSPQFLENVNCKLDIILCENKLVDVRYEKTMIQFAAQQHTWTKDLVLTSQIRTKVPKLWVMHANTHEDA